MIEKKLQQAAEALPENRSDFSVVENRITEKARHPRPVRRRRLAIAMVLAVLLVGCVAVTEPDYHLYNGNWWNFIPGLFSDPADDFEMHDDLTRKAAEELGITLPETLGGHPIISYNRYNLTTKRVPIQLAWLSPKFVYHSSYYGVEKEEPWVSPNGIAGTRHWVEGAQIKYGPTDDEIWHRQFGFDENDVYTAANFTLANHPVEMITSVEYEGRILYVGQFDFSNYEHPHWEVTWVDHGNGVVFSVNGEAETPDTLIEYAKEIIELNK